MSEYTQNENSAEQVQPRFALYLGEDELSGDWLQRVLYQPLGCFDVQAVKLKVAEIEERRNKSNAELEQEFNEICLELEAWASARPDAEHQAAFDSIESKVHEVHEESEKQERLRQHLLRFVEVVNGALSLLSSASQIFSPDADANAITTADSMSQVPVSSPQQPQILVPDSEVDVE